jgi:hypothetical protein
MKKLFNNAALTRLRTPAEEDVDRMTTVNVDDNKIRWSWLGTGACILFAGGVIELDR